MSYDDHDKILEYLKNDQDAEEDLREEIDEIINFINHPQGQWEPEIWNDFEDRPRYTFDQQDAAISRVWAEMAANEYAATTQPVGGGANEDTSNVIDGLIRNIYNQSGFDDISTKAGRRMIGTGFGGWRLSSQYIGESFYQDLLIEYIPEVNRRVWFDCNSEKQTREDSMHVFVMAEMMSDTAEEKFGRDVISVDVNRKTTAYYNKRPRNVVIGEILYKKEYKKDLHLLNDEESSVVDDEGLQRMQEQGLSPDIVDTRKDVACFKVYSRKFDGKGWLGKEKETVFSHLPVIPEYAHHDITEGKVTYKGIVRGRMDSQRVFNYSESRKVEEVVLAARRKTWLDDRAAEGYTDELSEINRNPSAIQLFNGSGADNAKHAPMFETGGPNSNPGITEISNDMIRNMSLNSNIPSQLEDLQMTGRDSDYRAEQRSSMGQMGTFEFYRAHKMALEYTAKVMLDAIPRVYDTDRKIRTVDEAGQSSEVRINNNVNGQIMNNLTMGNYDITVKVGKEFQSRQAEANDGIMRMGEVAPDVVSRNTDIIASNIDAPGMGSVADRERAFLLKQGVIPQSQFTDEEKEQAMQAAQNQQEDPMAVAAQAEATKAQAEVEKVQTSLLIEQAKLEQKQLEIQLNKQDSDNQTQIKALELQLKQQAQDVQELKDVAQAYKYLAEAGATENLSKQQQVTDQAQEEVLGN